VQNLAAVFSVFFSTKLIKMSRMTPFIAIAS